MAAPQVLRRLSSAKRSSLWLNALSRTARFSSMPENEALLFSSAARRRQYVGMLGMILMGGAGLSACAWAADQLASSGFPPATLALADDHENMSHELSGCAKDRLSIHQVSADVGCQGSPSQAWGECARLLRVSDECHEVANFCRMVSWD